MNDEKECNIPVEEVEEVEEVGEEGSEFLEDIEESQPDLVDQEKDQPSVSIELLTSQLEDARKEARDNWEQLLRARADLDNLRRRSQKELQDAHKFAAEKFARELLPVLDSLELGFEAANSDSGASDIKKLREGVELTLLQFKSVMEKFNIETLAPMGEAFNPQRHQAMMIEVKPDVEPNTIIRVFQKGYLLNGRLLRPALVVVSQAQNPGKIDEQA
ncbi:MAG: nucleotide exchange factor GrpE [Methylococcales bacterium]